MVRSVLEKVWGEDLDFQTPAATAQRMLSEAYRRDPTQFWSYFVLGRILYADGQYRAAEMAFNNCVLARPDYPVSYQLRGLAICRRALDPRQTEPRERQELLKLVDEDFQLAEEKDPTNPVKYWQKAELAELLGRHQDALEEYARGLESEDQLRLMVSRRRVLQDAARLADRVLKKNPQSAAAYAVRAWVCLTEQDFPGAEAAARKALGLQKDQPRALAVLGTVHLTRGQSARQPDRKREEQEQAVGLFQKALARQRDYYPAAFGLALAYEGLGGNAKALEAFDFLLTGVGPGRRTGPGQKSRPAAGTYTESREKKVLIAATDSRQVEAHQGRYRVLRKLGRTADADAALQAARRLDPTATGAARAR
jgi:tetratricopeptide (TPR) repeat protein